MLEWGQYRGHKFRPKYLKIINMPVLQLLTAERHWSEAHLKQTMSTYTAFADSHEQGLARKKQDLNHA